MKTNSSARFAVMPTLSHLQFLVIAQMRGVETRGQALKHSLSNYGVSRTRFYLLLVPMILAGYIGFNLKRKENSLLKRECFYSPREKGLDAARVSQRFVLGDEIAS